MEITLPHAVNRHVMKLGETEGSGAGLAPERAYAQAHTAEELMRQQIHEVLAEQAKAAGAVTDEKIKIPASRNPGGVYSDASGGIQTDSYNLTP